MTNSYPYYRTHSTSWDSQSHLSALLVLLLRYSTIIIFKRIILSILTYLDWLSQHYFNSRYYANDLKLTVFTWLCRVSPIKSLFGLIFFYRKCVLGKSGAKYLGLFCCFLLLWRQVCLWEERAGRENLIWE